MKIKGAFAEFRSELGVSVPNLIIFQFNPETLKHTWTQSTPVEGGHPLAVEGPPGEAFSFTLSMDANDALAQASVPPSPAYTDAAANGIYSRLSALEMLMFPVGADSDLAMPPGLPGGAGEQREVPALLVPTVLFVWGEGRIVPVRVLGLTITEKLFDEALNPTQADAIIELQVLTPAELEACTGPLKEIAATAYHYTQGRRELNAIANLNNAVGTVSLPPALGI